MKISIVHYSCPPFVGGVETVVEAHARKFSELGFSASVIAGQGRKFCPGIPVKIIPEMKTLYSVNIGAHEEITRRRPGEHFEAVKKTIYRKLKKELSAFDACIIHNVLTMHFNLALTGALCDLIGELKDTRFIAWIHDTALTDENYRGLGGGGYPWKILGTALKRVEYVAISNYRREKTAELFGVNPSSIRVIPDGIDPVSFLKLNESTNYLFKKLRLFGSDVIFLYPARIVKRKNIELAIEIVREMNNSGKDARLLLTSQPDPHNEESMLYFQKLKKLSRRLGIYDKIVFVSEVVNAEGVRLTVDEHMLRDLYLISDFLLFTSSAEGFGIPMLEAGLCKLPIVCAFIPPLEEIGGDNVVYISPDDPPSRTAALLSGRLENSGELKMFRKVIRDYTWDAIFRKKIIPLMRKP